MAERLVDVDRAKGVGIFLVVLGHLVAQHPPVGNEWWWIFKKHIYMVHMPLLMCLSGIVLAYTWKPIRTFADYQKYIAKKFMRLMPPFFLFALIIFFGKYLAQRYVHVDHQVHSFNQLFLVIIRPVGSVSLYLWFIFALFMIYLMVPALLKLSGGRLYPLLCLALLVYFLPSTRYFALNKVSEYLLFFLIGMHIGRNYESFREAVCKDIRIYFYAFIVSLAAAFFIPKIPALLVGLLGIPALIGLVMMPEFKNDRFLKMLGNYIFPIYLMHTIAIGMTKAVMLNFSPWDHFNFIYYIPVLLAAGLFIPLVLKKYGLCRIPVLDKVTG